MRRFTRLPPLLCLVLSLPCGTAWCLTLPVGEGFCGWDSKQSGAGNPKAGRDQEPFRSAGNAIPGSRCDDGATECRPISGAYPENPLLNIMDQAMDDACYLEGGFKNLAQAEAGYREWLQFFSEDDPAHSRRLKKILFLQSQEQPKDPQALPNWQQLFEPVRPPLKPEVRALSDKDKDGLFGPVKVVRETFEFTSRAKPEWNPEWADRPESDYLRTITYDLTGEKLSDLPPADCGMRAPQKEIYDDNARRVELISYTRNGTVERRALFSYDFKGWLVETNVYSPDGDLQTKWVYDYVSDSYGNWIARIPICKFGCHPVEGSVMAVLCRSISYH